jgi:hypothetical protein
MEFTGCSPLKHLEPTIELYYNGKVWDLHNVGEFQGFSYVNSEKKLVMNWTYFDEKGERLKETFRLKFLKTSAFEVIKRDSEIPFSEDDCLSEISFNDHDDSLLVKFMGGQEFRISCEEVKCSLD